MHARIQQQQATRTMKKGKQSPMMKRQECHQKQDRSTNLSRHPLETASTPTVWKMLKAQRCEVLQT